MESNSISQSFDLTQVAYAKTSVRYRGGEEKPPIDRYDPNGASGIKAALATPEGVAAFLEEKVTGGLKARFEEVFGTKAPDPFDRSPEATAGRIVRFATGFYEAYADRYGDTPETLDDFLSIVEGAIGEGFSQAISVIGSEPEVVRETRDFIKEYLETFREDRLRRLQEGEPAPRNEEAA